MAMASAIIIPNERLSKLEAKTAKPSGKLCIPMAMAVQIPMCLSFKVSLCEIPG